MQVTCVHCGMEAVVTPDFHQCRHCHGDLGSLVTAEFKSAYYFGKAQEAASQGAALVALEQINRGLRARNRSDLHLLACIIYADLGREEQLRMHIGAIPTEDALRPEAEALLKQVVERREKSDLSPENSDAQPASVEEEPHWAMAPRLLASLLTIVVVLGVVTVATQDRLLNSLTLDGWLPRALFRQAAPVETESPVPVETAPESEEPAPVIETADSAVPTRSVPSEDSPAEAPVPVSELSPEQWSESVTQNVLGLIARETIDFTQILVNRGHGELAGSEIIGVVQGPQLVLIGSVPSIEARQTVLEAVREFDGMGEVDAEGLQVVIPQQTHVIRQGESLWGIAERYLGDGTRWVDLVASNPELELGAGSLKAGATLVIPARVVAESVR